MPLPPQPTPPPPTCMYSLFLCSICCALVKDLSASHSSYPGLEPWFLHVLIMETCLCNVCSLTPHFCINLYKIKHIFPYYFFSVAVIGLICLFMHFVLYILHMRSIFFKYLRNGTSGHMPITTQNALALRITKTSPCNEYPLTPHFYIVKLWFTGVYIFFLFLPQNIDRGYSLEPPHRGGSNVYPQSMF